MNCHEAEPMLHPYVDGELDLVTALHVEEHVGACEACGREYRDIQELRREIADADLSYSPGPGLARRVSGRQPWWRHSWTLAAAAAVIVVLVVPWRRTGDDREVLDSHLRSLMASHLVDVPSTDHHTVKPWFQGRLSFSPSVPDLSPEGFVLTGGRLEMIQRAPAAAIVYKRRSHVINLFVAPLNRADSAPRARSAEGYNVVEWAKGGLSYWAVSDLNAKELMQFAELARGR